MLLPLTGRPELMREGVLMLKACPLLPAGPAKQETVCVLHSSASAAAAAAVGQGASFH
jgi:hypothetical protein